MKISSERGPLKRSAAKNCLLVNQFATPGLGSLMGRRLFAGAIQLTLAVLGFVLVIGWFVEIIIVSINGGTPGAASWMGKIGGLVFLASWVLAWFTSISLLREATNDPEPPLSTRPAAKPQPPILK